MFLNFNPRKLFLLLDPVKTEPNAKRSLPPRRTEADCEHWMGIVSEINYSVMIYFYDLGSLTVPLNCSRLRRKKYLDKINKTSGLDST